MMLSDEQEMVDLITKRAKTVIPHDGNYYEVTFSVQLKWEGGALYQIMPGLRFSKLHWHPTWDDEETEKPWWKIW